MDKVMEVHTYLVDIVVEIILMDINVDIAMDNLIGMEVIVVVNQHQQLIHIL